MTYDVGLSARAERDARAMCDWIAKQSLAGARRWFDAIDDAIAALAKDPLKFALAPESDAFPMDLREILFKTRSGNTYRALFCVEGEKVQVVSIRGPGQPFLTPEEI
ncbi:MAG: type II toxin-antitoxin system RelE/ParE family toxin [Pirellulaceae bacterium]